MDHGRGTEEEAIAGRRARGYGSEARGPVLAEGRTGQRRGETARQLIRRAKQASRRRFPAEEKIRIVMEGIRAAVSVADLCRREGIHPMIYYKWLKDFMEAGKGRLRGNARREATSNEVQDLRQENERLKLLVADLSLENLTPKKASIRASDRYAPFSPAGLLSPSAKIASFPSCYGPSYIRVAFEEYLRMHRLQHIRCSPHHPQTNGELERSHETLKGRMNLLVWSSPEQLREAIAEFIEFYNQRGITKESATSLQRMCTTGGGKKS